MIALDPQFVVSTQVSAGGQVVDTITTDTLYLAQFAAEFCTGTLYATIQRGTVTNDVFVANMPPYVVTVNPDGTFTLPDGSYSGTIPGTAAFVTSLKGPA